MANKYVPPDGPRDAKIVLLGESPGRLETVMGKPFVGPAGQQLDMMLNAAGLDRQKIYITNTVKYEPPGGDDKAGFFFRKGAPSHEYMQGILEVMEELKEVKPNVVVPLGNYALWALTQQTGISNWRGSIMESTMLPGLKVIPTYHPAFYIHQGGYNSVKEALGIWDLDKVREESTTPDLNLPKPKYIINPTPEEIEWAVANLLDGDHITSDTEWYGPERLAYIGFTNSPEWAICISPDSMQAYRAYKALLGSRVPKIFQNASFDTLALARQGIMVNGPIEDTMIAWHNCWADLGEKSLQVIGSVLTRHPYYKGELDYVQQGDDRGQIYNCTDCVVTDEAWTKIRDEEFPYTKGKRGYEIVQSIAPIMQQAAIKGIRADREKMEEMAKGYINTATELERILGEVIGYTINCRSAQQVIDLVYNKLGINRKIKTSKQEVLMDIAAGETREEIKAILTTVIRVRQNRNIVSRYLNPKNAIDKDGRIRTNWNLAGTRGGARLSATIFGRGESRWFPSVPMQTIPEEARVCYIADPGCVFLGWDLEQAEARVVAVKTRDYDLLHDMEEGIDIHTKLASMLPFGKTYDELLAMIADALIAGKSKDTVIERYLSKKCRHGLNYMMGSGTFRSTVNKEYLDTGVGITDKISKDLRKAYVKLHPGLEIWWHEVKGILKQNPRTMRTYHGRERQFLGHFTEDMWKEAIAFEPQALVADTVTLGMADADVEIKKLDPEAQFFCHMHDGGFMQVREEVALEAASILKRCMTREMIVDRTALTIPVEVKMGPNWLDLQKVKV